jgi:hypothetical protein
MAMALPAAIPCVYDAPIHPTELTLQKGFLQAGTCIFNDKKYVIIFTPNGPVIFDERKQIFDPRTLGEQTMQKFIKYSSNPRNLFQIDVVNTVQKFSQDFDFDCGGHKSNVYKSRVKMFCSGWLRDEDGNPIFDERGRVNVGIFESKLRFKLLCAFGLLQNFINPGMFNLMIRGGMALRMNLLPSSEFTHPNSASQTDMDGLVIVDASISDAMLNDFKTTFMKLLVLAIKNSIDPSDKLICRVARGDSDTVKIMINRKGAELELGDIGFKRVNDVIQTYSNNPMYLSVESMFFFPYVWFFPSREILQSEYDYLVKKTKQQLGEIVEHEENPEGTFFSSFSAETFPNFSNKSKLAKELKKFESKHETMRRGYGGKKSTVHRCKIKKRKYRTKKRH